MKQPKYKIYEGKLRDIFKQCLDEGRRPLTLFEVITTRNKKLIPLQYYHTSTFENNETGKIFDASVTQIKKILKTKDDSIWWPWVVNLLDDRSSAFGDYFLGDSVGRLVGVKKK